MGWSQSDLVIVIPVLGRAHRVRPVLTSAKRATPRARVVFVADPSDGPTLLACRLEHAQVITVPWEADGDYARKINIGYRATVEPLIFTGADDLDFHPGWLEAAVTHLAPGIGVVGTNDLGGRPPSLGEHATHSLITRTYADQWGTVDAPGAILTEAYHHNYVDNELVATAQARGAWAYAEDAIVEHLHPDWNPAIPRDPTYQLGRSRFGVDQERFEHRRHLWTR